MDELGIDMEELESRLYSQVYHSSAENQELPLRNKKQDTSTNTFKRPRRYFEVARPQPIEKTPEFISLNTSEDASANLLPISLQEREVFTGRYYDGMSTIPDRLIRMIAPCNNIVVIPQVPTQIVSQDILPTVSNRNLEKYLNRRHARELNKVKKMERQKRRKQAKKQKRLQAKELKIQQERTTNDRSFLEHNLSVKPISFESAQIDIIALSDSDNDDCVEIPEKRELVVLSSDDECKTNIKQERNIVSLSENTKTEHNTSDESEKFKNDDEVIFVEPEPKQIEVIEIDCDSVHTSLKDDEKQSETASINSDNIKVPNVPHRWKRVSSKERRELCTPDSSVSNDFLDNTVDLNLFKFNFGLHGSDFGNTNSSKPKPTDISETDSTTSDVTTKSNFFNVVDFEMTPKQFFDDTNLESFGKYITPNRNSVENAKDTNFEKVCTRASQRQSTIHDSSDSSSESDYDENKISYLNSKRLPELSTVHIETELVDKEDSLVVEEIPVGPKQMPEKNDAKRKLEDGDTSNKKQKLEEDVANKKEEVKTVADRKEQINLFVDDIEIGDHSNFIILDETGDEGDVVKDSDDTESYFSCDEFNNITSDLMLGNCHAQGHGKGDGNGYKQKRIDSKDEKTDYLNFSIEEVQRTMSDDPKLWKILDIDRLHFHYVTPRGPRCHRCREIGHVAIHCTNKRGPPACTLCGERTHAEPRCPMAMCTSCGRLGGHTTYCSRCASWRNIQCNVCKLYGHVDEVCPDAWRRYHLTTKPGPIVKPAVQTLKVEKDRWCSGCAQPGHFESACVHYNRTHFAVYPEVLNYVDLYDFPKSQPYIIHQEDDASAEKEKALTTVDSLDQFLDIIDSDEEDLTIPEDSFHDAETGSPDKKTNLDAKQLKTEDIDLNEMYFKINFPPVNFIPPYFRYQINYLRKQHLHKCKSSEYRDSNQNVSNISSSGSLRDMASSSTKSGTSASLEEFISLESNDLIYQVGGNNNIETKEKNNRTNFGQKGQQRKSTVCNQTLKLDEFQFAYIHLKHSIHFFNDIRRKPGIQLLIEKFDDRPAGVLVITGHSESSIVPIKRDILLFLHKMPFIKHLPRESRDMLDFLLRHKDMLDKAEGNCWTLCKKLCKLTNIGNRHGFTTETSKLKMNIQITIQLLLFGKLKLEHGAEHVNKIQGWIRTMKNKSNYVLSLNEIFEIHHSYTYLFEARKSIFPFKNLCAQHDHYILPTVDSCKRRKMAQRNRIYVENKSRFVMDTCKKFNLPNKFITELMAIQNAMQASKYSRICYGDFLRFMSRFRAYMKKHKIL